MDLQEKEITIEEKSVLFMPADRMDTMTARGLELSQIEYGIYDTMHKQDSPYMFSPQQIRRIMEVEL